MDVNLHPTKREVGFLHQEELTEAVCSAIQDRLTKSNDQCALLVPSAKILTRHSWDAGSMHRKPFPRGLLQDLCLPSFTLWVFFQASQ